jgi:hypothetical protein
MPLADTLLRLAELPALYQPRWTDEILAEVTRTLIGRFGQPPRKAAHREFAMRSFFPNSMVHDFERLIPEMRNHPKDRHVLAAAVKCQAEYLVTLNLKDFPSEAVEKYDVKVAGPATFLKQLWALHQAVVHERLSKQASDIGVQIRLLLDRLATSVPAFVTEIRSQFD